MGAQRFIGIRSGLTGQTIIFFPVYTGGELRVRDRSWRPDRGSGVINDGFGPVLGRLTRRKLWENHGVAVQEDGVAVDCGIHISTLDASMAVLQHLSDLCDSRLDLEGYAAEMAGAVAA